MVPNGWEVKSLDSVSKVIDCKHRTPKYVKEGVPLVSPGTIKWGALDLITPTKRVSTEEYSSLMDHCTVNVGDLVLSRNQSVGVASFVESEEPFVLGQDTVLVKLTEADSRFLFYNLQSVETQRTIFKLAGGSTFSRINLGDIRKLKAIYPPLSEQRKIAKILSTWDKAINTTERLIDNSKQHKKAFMQQLLTGKKRLLDDSGKSFESEWEEKRLSELGDIYSGGTPSTAKPEYWDGDINWVTPTDITKQDSIYIESTARLVSMDGIKNSSAKLLPRGTLLVCTRATIGAMAIASHEMSTNQGFKNIVPNEKTNIEFVYYLLNFYKHKLISKASGSTFLELSKSAFEGMHFHIPDYQEQKKIAAVLLNADREIDVLQQQLTDLKQEKKALMQQLLTGKRRVKTDDKEVA